MSRNDIDWIRRAIAVARASRASGNHPFGAVLIGPAGEELMWAGNTYLSDRGPGHAETNLARAAAQAYPAEYLTDCTLVTTVEPCCMCAGASYWAGIGSIVYGLSEVRLAEMTGDNPENLTLAINCRSVFAAGRRQVEVRGPYPELEAEILVDHLGFW